MQEPQFTRFLQELLKKGAAHKPDTLTIEDEGTLTERLELHNVPYQTWKKGVLDKLFEELREREPTFMSNDGRLVSCIRTVTIRIYYDLPPDASGSTPNDRRLFLREFKKYPNSGKLVPRRHENSMSEKLKWDEDGDHFAVKRAFREELRKVSTEEQVILTDDDFCTIVPDKTQVVGPIPLRESTKFPGLLRQNELHPYICILRAVHYDPMGYYELRPDRTSLFRWSPVGGQWKN